jgi:hypothetical protein
VAVKVSRHLLKLTVYFGVEETFRFKDANAVGKRIAQKGAQSQKVLVSVAMSGYCGELQDPSVVAGAPSIHSCPKQRVLLRKKG